MGYGFWQQHVGAAKEFSVDFIGGFSHVFKGVLKGDEILISSYS